LLKVQSEQLESECRATAERLRKKLDADCHVVISAPFVIGGDFSAEKLRSFDRDFLRPVQRALQTCYFDRTPTEPITVLIFSNNRAFRTHARRFDGSDRRCYSGYYLRRERRIVLDVSTGHGTLAHELTHAFAHFDFPQMPEWFDEGLASLHEQSAFSEDELRLDGLNNWRLNVLRPELERNRLPQLKSLMTERTVRGPREGLRYAMARYFCLYLQQRRLLSHYYRKCRAMASRDKTGVLALKELLHVDTLDAVDRDFRKWLNGLKSSDL